MLWAMVLMMQAASAQPPAAGAAADNARLTAVFEADQHDRMTGAIDWSKVSAADAARRTEVGAMLRAGTVVSGADYWHAAFVVQHGDAPRDYLLAHTLAVTAVAKGYPGAGWIAAATLDRYLNETGRPQVYGTQFLSREHEPVTQEPYDRTLLGDDQRRAVGVPTLVEQEERRRSIEAESRKTPPR